MTMPRLEGQTVRQALSRLKVERKCAKEHGNLIDYVKRYGSKYDRVHTGDGGEEIYAADMANLIAAQAAYQAALARGRLR
jgi:membrane glycosyltransferase